MCICLVSDKKLKKKKKKKDADKSTCDSSVLEDSQMSVEENAVSFSGDAEVSDLTSQAYGEHNDIRMWVPVESDSHDLAIGHNFRGVPNAIHYSSNDPRWDVFRKLSSFACGVCFMS